MAYRAAPTISSILPSFFSRISVSGIEDFCGFIFFFFHFSVTNWNTFTKESTLNSQPNWRKLPCVIHWITNSGSSPTYCLVQSKSNQLFCPSLVLFVLQGQSPFSLSRAWGGCDEISLKQTNFLCWIPSSPLHPACVRYEGQISLSAVAATRQDGRGRLKEVFAQLYTLNNLNEGFCLAPTNYNLTSQ